MYGTRGIHTKIPKGRNQITQKGKGVLSLKSTRKSQKKIKYAKETYYDVRIDLFRVKKEVRRKGHHGTREKKMGDSLRPQCTSSVGEK